jgi:hypothetical protein
MLHCKKMLRKRDQAVEGPPLRTKREHARFAHASIEKEPKTIGKNDESRQPEAV